MLRDVIKKHYMGMNQGFRYRGEEPGRLENFSDAVSWVDRWMYLLFIHPCHVDSWTKD